MSPSAPVVRLLGPAAVVLAGTEHPVARPRRRAVLAALALRADRVVRVSELVAAVWGDRAPASAAGNLHTYVCDLRALLEPADRAKPSVLVGHRDGYRLALAPEQVDVLAFEELARRGRERVAGGDLTGGLAELDDALALWRGEPFAGTGGPLCDAERERLLHLRPAVDEARFQALLGTGRAAEVVPDCVRLVREHPLRERVVTLLAEALLRCGRPADALDELTGLRRRLRAELGTRPGPEATALYQRILDRGEAEPRPATRPAPRVVPAQLPQRFWAFAGREREVVELSARVEQGVPVVLSGLPGIGKTALAVEIAHRMAPRFPDGQLFLDLRAGGADPVSLDEALDYHLRVLGVSEEDMPDDTGDRIRRYRELIAGRRVLVVLDDALPAHLSALTAGGSSVTIATTRERSAAPVPGHPSALRELRPEAALAVLTADLPGTGADEADLAALAELCGRVPLALRVMAARLAVGETAAELVAELRTARRPLDSFEFGGGSLRPSYDRSAAALPPDAAGLLDVLVAHPGREFDTDLVPVLRPGVVAGAALDPLLRLGFLDRVGTRRYRVPDLVWHYAAERAAALDPAEVEAAALRAVRWYAHAADAVDRALDPLRPLRLPLLEPGGHTGGAEPSGAGAFTAPAATADHAELLAWSRRSRPVLVRASVLAAGLGRHRLSWHLARCAEAFGADPVLPSTSDSGDLAEALRRFAAGDHAGACGRFRAELDRPDSPERLLACVGAAVCARETGAHNDAVLLFRSALRLRAEGPVRAWVLAQLADAALAAGRGQLAVEAAAESVSQWERSGEAAGAAAAGVLLARAHGAVGSDGAAAGGLRRAAEALRRSDHREAADAAGAGLVEARVS
ncbi:AfsR/SARP family transcriptional regulator [Actinokineospora bangkokensis]|uniref:OmpR/PhoB-type domain-containing protein n=1 Tax=Actinokineospora bangkokensis TaxID=1193682 RepID=A0A1Q9LJK8_9PSEU|nr:BTAD domain-containing putative transcriptional regulator [Actinokineospora bangkokensis]OLR92185.1 hypothetical protein BJP25_22910 [Actinokineospora bangkokensis]